MLASAYQQAAERTRNRDLTAQERQVYAILGLASEAGEVADLLKKRIGHARGIAKDDLVAELGDVAWYLAETASAFGLDLDAILERNVSKLQARYPEGFSTAASLNRPAG